MSPRDFDNDHEPDLGNEDLDLPSAVDDGPSMNDWDDEEFEAGGRVGDDGVPAGHRGPGNGRYDNGNDQEEEDEDEDALDEGAVYVDEDDDSDFHDGDEDDEDDEDDDEEYDSAFNGEDGDSDAFDDDEFDDGEDSYTDEFDDSPYDIDDEFDEPMDDSDDDEFDESLDNIDDEEFDESLDDIEDDAVEAPDDSLEGLALGEGNGRPDEDGFDTLFDEEDEGASYADDDPEALPEEPFHDEFHYALIEADDTVRSGLEQIINSCWYTDDLIVVAMDMPENQAACDAWVRAGLGEGFDVVTVTADLMMTADEIFDEVAAELQELGAYRAPVVAGEKPRELVVHIDHAHELGAGVFDALMSLVERSDSMVTPHIVLWGEQQPMNELDSLFEARNVPVTYVDIPRFSASAVAAYLGAAWSQQVPGHPLPLSAQECARIAQASNGQVDALDRLANEALARQLSAKEQKRSPVITSGMAKLQRLVPRRHALATLALVGVLALVLVFSQGGDTEGPSGNTTVVRLERTPAPPVRGPAQTSAEPGYTPPASAAGGGMSTPASAAPVESQAEAVSGQVGVSEGTVPGGSPEIGEQPAPATSAEVGQAPRREDQAVPSMDTAPQPQAAASDAAASQAQGSPETGRLLSYPDDHLFIQLMGSFSEDAVQQFIRDNMSLNGSNGQFFTVESRYQGRPWHVVVYGPFTTRARAEQARDALPARVREGSPWIRTVADIRQSSPQ